MNRPRWSLSGRIMAVTMLSAGVAVLVAAVVSLGLFHLSAQQQGRQALQSKANLVANAMTVSANGKMRVPPTLATTLARARIEVLVVQPDGAITGPEGRVAATTTLRGANVATVLSGRAVSTTQVLGGARTYVEAQPVASGGAVVLLQRVAAARASEGPTRLRIGTSLAIGLAVAAVFGMLLARRLGRPLQRAAAAAHRLSTGARDVRLDPVGPAEVAEVADALNALSAALATSEGRQREFLLSVSHELRTPLTAVKGYAEAFADGVVPADAVAVTGQVVLAEATRLERLVSDLLDLARLGAQDFRIDVQPVDVAELLRDAAKVWADRCDREGVTFAADIPGGALVVNTDPTRLRQIVDGLAENALRVTPAGRPIVFALVASSAESEVVFQVRDGGPGLTDDDCRVAFERSALYDRYRGVRRVGTGVGLALVAGLAHRLGGRATAGRAPEGGACFAIHLPGR